MNTQPKTSQVIAASRYENGKALLIAGLRGRYLYTDKQGIPLQWQRFSSYLGRIPGQIGGTAYGVCDGSGEKGSIDYLTGDEVTSLSGLPAELSSLSIPQHRHAVFSHAGPVAAISDTISQIWNHWLPGSGQTAVEAPFFK
jgi:AraC family transcriptional regulator